MKNFIFATDHKRVGLLFLFTSMTVFSLAGFVAILIRIEKATLGPTIIDSSQTYNEWLYFHGAAMVLAYVIPALTGFFASYFVPLMIGADDVAFPRLNALSFWFYFAAVVVAIISFIAPDAPDIMWTGYPPYSVLTTSNTAFYVFTVLLVGVSGVLGAVNFLLTIYFKRAKGMKFRQMNIFVWAILAAFVDQLIFVPVLSGAMLLLLADKYLGTAFFDPTNGGDVLVFQNLFWFYSHPAVYVIFLPAIGIVFEIFSTMSKNKIFQFNIAVYFGIWVTMIIAGEVWVHHLYVTGMPDWIRIGMMVTTLLISVPIGLLTVSLIGTLYRGSITYNSAMYYAIAAMYMLLIGGLTGIPLGMTAIDISLSDTTFVHAHFHFVMALFATYAIFGGIYYYFPKITGKMANEKLGKLGFWLNVIGSNITFFPLFIIGVQGMPRRYYDYQMFPEFEDMHKLATAGAIMVFVAVAITFASWIKPLFSNEKASDNPWFSKSLEWTNSVAQRSGESIKIEDGWTPYEYGKKTD